MVVTLMHFKIGISANILNVLEWKLDPADAPCIHVTFDDGKTVFQAMYLSVFCNFCGSNIKARMINLRISWRMKEQFRVQGALQI